MNHASNHCWKTHRSTKCSWHGSNKCKHSDMQTTSFFQLFSSSEMQRWQKGSYPCWFGTSHMVLQGHTANALNFLWWMGSLLVILLEQVAWLLDGVGPLLTTQMASFEPYGSPQVNPAGASFSPALDGPWPWVARNKVGEIHTFLPHFVIYGWPHLAFHGHLWLFLGLHILVLLVILLGGCSAMLQALVFPCS